MKNIDKKYIYIGIAVIIVIIGLIIILIRSNNKSESFTCTSGKDHLFQEWVFIPKNNELSKLTIKYNKLPSDYDYETLAGLTETQKQKIQQEVLYEFDIDKSNYEGLEIKVNYSEYITIEINIDYSTADTNLLNKIGLNYNRNMKFSDIKGLLKEDGSLTCK